MPPVIRRQGTLGVALALALSIGAIEAPLVAANTTSTADHTGAIGLEFSGPGEAFVSDWLDSASAAAPAVPVALSEAIPVARKPQEPAIVGWHDVVNEKGKLTTNNKPSADPKPVQPRSDARKIVRLARQALGARFRMGATGQKVGRKQYYDCSGLVYRIYREAGLLSRVGGARRGATSFYNWFKSRGLVSKSNPKVGDLVVYQYRGQRVIPHMGVYIGNGKVISALINPWGVRVHGVKRLPTPFKAYLHVRIGR